MRKALALTAIFGAVLVGFSRGAIGKNSATMPAISAPSSASAPSSGAATKAATTHPALKVDEKAVIAMLNMIPGDSAGFVIFPDLGGARDRADVFVHDILPKSFAEHFGGFRGAFMGEFGLGEGFDDAGPAAVILPSSRKPASMPATSASGDEAGDNSTPPLVSLFFCKDPNKMFAGYKIVEEGDVLKLSRGGQTEWAIQKGGVMCVSNDRGALASLGRKASIVPRLSKGVESMLLRADAGAWIDTKAFAAMKKANLLTNVMPGLFSEIGRSFFDEDNPLGKVVRWFRMTRAGLLTSAEQWAFALTFGPEGPIVEARGAYTDGSPMAKALSAAAKSDGAPPALTLPDKPFIFAYGIRKDVFSTPAEMKSKALAALAESNAMESASPDEKKQVAAMIAAIHAEVTEVQHWAGQTKEDGPLAVATVVRCRDAEALRKIIKRHVPAFQAVVNCAFALPASEDANENKWQLTLEEANEPGQGQARIDSILVSHPMLDKAIQEEAEMARKMLLKVFPGEMKIRARLAAADDKTLIVTIGGGRRFMNEALLAAKGGAGKGGHDDNAKAALAPLPANRFGVAMFSVTRAAGFYGSIMVSMLAGGAQIHFPVAPPAAMAMSADRGELILTAHIPSETLKKIIGKASGEEEAGEGAEEDEEDAISVKKVTTVPATIPAPVAAGD
jgi:hypothetical protein